MTPQLTGIAQALAAQGRHGDSVLLHISPMELAYLQRVAKKHGRVITVNPKTGLPEAFGLGDLVGPIVGAGLSMFAPGMSPLLIGLLSGAAGGLATGNMGKGILGGLMGGGISSILGSMGSMGAETLAQPLAAAGGETANMAAQQLASNSVLEQAAQAGSNIPTEFGMANVASATPELMPNGMVNYSALSPELGTSYDKVFQEAYGANNFPTTDQLAKDIPISDRLKSGASQAFQSPMDFYNKNKYGIGALGVGALGMASYNQTLEQQKALQKGSKDKDDYEFDSYTKPGTYRPAPTGGYPNTYRPEILGTAFADGGSVNVGSPLMDVLSSSAVSQYKSPTKLTDLAGASAEPSLEVGSVDTGNPFANVPPKDRFGALFRMALGKPWKHLEQPPISAVPASFNPGNFKDVEESYKGGSIRLAKGGITTYRKGKKAKFAPMPGTISEKKKHRSITQALRAMYESKASAASDLANPESPIRKMGIAGIKDPMLTRAFKHAPPVAMAQGGRFLDGPGDGLSDSVRANIDGQREARLSDGEFVVSADVVSGIGNGSSKAGAKKLMAMMHKVRKRKHGTTKQPGPINEKGLLPV